MHTFGILIWIIPRGLRPWCVRCVIYAGHNGHRAPVAQWIERLPSKQRVAGSSPARRASFVCFPRSKPITVPRPVTSLCLALAGPAMRLASSCRLERYFACCFDPLPFSSGSPWFALTRGVLLPGAKRGAKGGRVSHNARRDTVRGRGGSPFGHSRSALGRGVPPRSHLRHSASSGLASPKPPRIDSWALLMLRNSGWSSTCARPACGCTGSACGGRTWQSQTRKSRPGSRHGCAGRAVRLATACGSRPTGRAADAVR